MPGWAPASALQCCGLRVHGLLAVLVSSLHQGGQSSGREIGGMASHIAGLRTLPCGCKGQAGAAVALTFIQPMPKSPLTNTSGEAP